MGTATKESTAKLAGKVFTQAGLGEVEEVEELLKPLKEH